MGSTKFQRSPCLRPEEGVTNPSQPRLFPNHLLPRTPGANQSKPWNSFQRAAVWTIFRMCSDHGHLASVRALRRTPENPSIRPPPPPPVPRLGVPRGCFWTHLIGPTAPGTTAGALHSHPVERRRARTGKRFPSPNGP